MTSKKFTGLMIITLLAVFMSASASPALDFYWPVPGYTTLTTTYYYSSGAEHSCRYRYNGRPAGIDIAVPSGTQVLAPAAGTVQSLADLGNRSFGRYFEIKHDDGTITLYAHLSSFNVSNGQRVNVGDVIAWSGSTGNSTGPHLHYEMSNRDTYQYYQNNGYLPPPPSGEKPPISPGLLRLSSSSYAKSFTLTNGRYSVYSDANLSRKLSSSAWTGEDDDDWILGTGWNSRNVPYARISYPAGSKRQEAYVNLQEVFVKGTIDEGARTAVNGYTGLYQRKNSGKNNSYWIDAGDSVWLLTKEDGWAQVLYPISSSKYRIAWLRESDYNGLFQKVKPALHKDTNIKFTYSFYNGTVGQSYSDWIRVTSPKGIEYGQTISGSLPDGMSISLGEKTYLVGTPTRAGTYRFTMRIVDPDNGYNDYSCTVTIAPAAYPISGIAFTFGKGKLGVPYSDFVYISGGTAPFRAARTSGTLPIGLELSVSGRLIYLKGTPKRYGTFVFVVKATDTNGSSAEEVFDLTIADNPSYSRAGAGEDDGTPSKPEILTSKLSNAATGNEYSVKLEASGTGPITWTLVDGELPEGLVMDADGKIAGTPSLVGKSKFKVKAANSQGSDEKKYTIAVNPAKPVITTTVIPDAVLGQPYTFRVEADGIDIKYSKKGKFPSGLKLNKYNGEITGTPKKAGTFTFSIKAKNKGGTDLVEYTMTVGKDTGTKASAAAASVGTRDSAYNPVVLGLQAAAAGMFRIDAEGEKLSGVRVFVDDEAVDGVEVSDDGTFTLPEGEYGDGFSVYASGLIDGEEFETEEVDVEAGGADEKHSGGCSAGMSGMIALLAFGALIFRKK